MPFCVAEAKMTPTIMSTKNLAPLWPPWLAKRAEQERRGAMKTVLDVDIVK